MPKLNAYAIKKPAFVLGLADLIAVKGDSNMRLTASPFAGDDVVFVGKAADWKGTKGAAFEKKAPAGVVSGLRAAIGISKACAGVKGTTMVGGRLLPKKVVCQMERGKRK